MLKYFYNIGYNTHEESQYWQLYSDEKYTEEQLAEIVSDAFVEVYKLGGYKLDDYDFVMDGILVRNGKVQHLYPSVIRYLVDNLGFSQIEFETGYSIDGWAYIDKNSDFVDGGVKLIRNKLKHSNYG